MSTRIGADILSELRRTTCMTRHSTPRSSSPSSAKNGRALAAKAVRNVAHDVRRGLGLPERVDCRQKSLTVVHDHAMSKRVLDASLDQLERVLMQALVAEQKRDLSW